MIVVAIDDTAQDIIYGMNDPEGIWKKLKETFVPRTKLRRLQAFRALATATLHSGEEMQDYVNRVRMLAVESEEAGNEKVSDETLCNILLAGLPEKYSGIVAVTEAFEDREYNSQRIETLIVGEARRQQHAAAQAELIHPRKTAEGSQVMAVDRNQRMQHETRHCYNCGERGHLARACQRPKEAWKAHTPETRNPEKRAAAVTEVELLHVRRQIIEANACTTDAEGRWLIDCGATDHMCPDRRLFDDYRTVGGEQVRLADSTVCVVAGIGDVTIWWGKRALKLRDVLHIP